MKNFWGSFLGSILGASIAGVLFAILVIAGVAAVVSSEFGGSEQVQTEAEEKTVLHLTFSYPVVDSPDQNPFAEIDFGSGTKGKLTLWETINVLDYASTDDKVVGIFLDMDGLSTGMGNAFEIRQALERFKAKGKFIATYSEGLSQKAYYFASVSTHLSLNAHSDFLLNGMGAELLFFRGVLDKIGVEPYAVRPSGNKFKSAVEPFLLTQASESNRIQMRALMGSMWKSMGSSLVAKNKLPSGTLDSLINGLHITSALDAQKYRFSDTLEYRDEFMNRLAKLAGWEKWSEDESPLQSLEDYGKMALANLALSNESENQVAILVAEGDIVDGKSSQGMVGSTSLNQSIRELRENDDVKAVVLRVNSPGGSALASELMWRELALLKAKKPVVVSMGNLAASGGYYISCHASKVFANPTTITGSIGVFGLLFNAKGLLNEKLGVTTDTINLHANGDFPTGSRPLREREKEVLEKMVTRIYGEFTQRVANGRSMKVDMVDSIGQGRVWSGEQAKQLGLVDGLGGLKEAVQEAAKLAKVSYYTTAVYPKPVDPFEAFFEGLSENSKALLKKEGLGFGIEWLALLKKVENMQGVNARLPFDIQFND
ncbi:MAG: signal peptide peptidase SppA [Bacteroidetes bacterium]|nr:signal peptide peptidase SppA [Bacteroidota bacterium]